MDTYFDKELVSNIIQALEHDSTATHTYYADINATIKFISIYVEDDVIHIGLINYDEKYSDDQLIYRLKFIKESKKLEPKLEYILKYIRDKFNKNVK